MRLTDISIRKLPLPDHGQKTYHDDSLGGFGVRCSQKSKSFVIKYGKTRRLKTLGRYPAMSLSVARLEAKRFIALHNPRTASTSYSDAITSFLEDAERRNRPNTVREYRRYLNNLDSSKQVDDITRRELQDHLDRYSETPTAYKNALVSFKVFFNWAIRHELTDRHPLAGERAPSLPSRDRVLTPEEIQKLWAYEYPNFSTILKLLLVTGQRRTEIASIQPKWINEDELLLTIPPEVCKNGKRHAIPITESTLELLKKAPFGTDGPWNGWSNGKKRIDKHVKIPHWRLHDCRRVYSTIHAELGTEIHLVERLLNHSTGASTSGVVGIYNRFNYLEPMRKAQVNYENCLTNILNITSFKM